MIVSLNKLRKYLNLTTDEGLPKGDSFKRLPLAFSLKMLIITDTHNCLECDEIEAFNNYDVCFLLGDLTGRDLKRVKDTISPRIPIYGLLGNHNSFGDLIYYGIEDIHGKKIIVNDIPIVGWQGSIKYKDIEFPSFTDHESLAFAMYLPKVEILLSHDSPKYYHGKDFAHSGLRGITKYLKDNQVPLNIHGHHHVNEAKTLENGTLSMCVHKCTMIDTALL